MNWLVALMLTITQPGTYDGQGATITGLELKGNDITAKNYVMNGGEIYMYGNRLKIDNVKGKAARLVVNKWNLPLGAGTQDVGVYNCDLWLGQGVTTGEHIMLWWNVDRPVIKNSKIKITREAALGTGQSGAGGWWNFACRNGTYDRDTIRIIETSYDYASMRWRGDKSLVDGCHDNVFNRTAIIVEGPGRILWSSSADPGTTPGMGNLVGHWNVTIDSCLISCGDEQYWQGGMGGKDGFVQITNSRLVGKTAIHAIDIHRVRLQGNDIQSNVQGGVAEFWDDDYGRPLPAAGDLVDCNNRVVGTVKVDATIAAHPEWRVTTCGPPPVEPPVVVPPPADTVRVTIDSPLPVKVTVK